MYYKNIKSSSDGLNLSIAYSIPKEKPKGIIQFSHGIAEHKERYFPFMEYLTNNGYICIINDHRGHGNSIKSQNDLGNFYTNNIDYIINDLYDVTKFAKNKFNCNNYYMFSHSMGTLVVRNYIQKYDKKIKKLILCGPPTDNKRVHIGLALAYITSIFCYNKRNVNNYNKDNLCGFTFTTNGFINLYRLQIKAFKKELYNCNNKNLKILILAGKDAPVIGNINLFNNLKSFLLNVGYNDINSKLYEQLRHEILNEENNIIIYQDILKFLEIS